MQRTKTTKVLSLRSYTSFSLFILDIDYFKQINDHYRHNCDDEVLIKLPHCMPSILPSF